jgi:glycosyltransferase involved in cell wall biosynthesis
MNLRIVIDMQGAQTESRFRGIGRYSLSIAQAIVRNRGEHEVVLVLNGLFPDTIEPIRAAFNGLLPQENIRVWYAPGPTREATAGNESRRNVAELIREAFLASLSPDVIHITSLFEGYADDAVLSIDRFDRSTPVSVSLYDLIPLLNPEQYLKPNKSYEQYYLRRLESLRQSALCLAISEFSALECIQYLQALEGRIVNISTANDSCFVPLNMTVELVEGLTKKFEISRPFVLYAGGADERKNLPRLIKGFAQLPVELRKNHQLVFAGKMPARNIVKLKQQAKAANMNPDELCFIGHVTNAELVHLYNSCQVFVLPSWHEGFGLPVLEAMACGAAVIAANTSSLPEVTGRADMLFDPFDVHDICKKLTLVLQDERFRTNLKTHGLTQAKNFNWDKCAQRAISAFEAIAPDPMATPGHWIRDRIVEDLVASIASNYSSPPTPIDILATAKAVSRIPNGSLEKQIFVDISELAHRDSQTGIQRVTRSIVKELLENPPDGYLIRPVYGMLNSQGYRHANKFIANFLRSGNSLEDDELIEYQAGDIFLGLDLQHHVTCYQKEFLAGLRQDGVRVIYVVYDLLPITLPDAFPRGARAGHEEWLRTLAQFDGALCISQAVANELADWLKATKPDRLRPFQIDWFHLGADIANSAPSTGLPSGAAIVLAKLQASPSFLMVGTIEPRKGHAPVLAAFDELWAQGVQTNLVIIGTRGWMVEELIEAILHHPQIGKRLFWLEGISDEYLEKIYAASTCLIAASLGEGFGLPLIEAAQHGLPIIARDIPVFREVAGECAFYFSNSEKNTLTADLTKWLELYRQKKNPVSDQMHWLTWRESAKQLLASVLPSVTESIEHQRSIDLEKSYVYVGR